MRGLADLLGSCFKGTQVAAPDAQPQEKSVCVQNSIKPSASRSVNEANASGVHSLVPPGSLAPVPAVLTQHDQDQPLDQASAVVPPVTLSAAAVVEDSIDAAPSGTGLLSLPETSPFQDAALCEFEICLTDAHAQAHDLVLPPATDTSILTLLSSPASLPVTSPQPAQAPRTQGATPRRRVPMSRSANVSGMLLHRAATQYVDLQDILCRGLTDMPRNSPSGPFARQRMSGFEAAASFVRMVASCKLDSSSPIRQYSTESAHKWVNLVESAHRRYSVDMEGKGANGQRAC